MKYESDDHMTMAVLGEIFIVLGFALLCDTFRGFVCTLMILGGITTCINMIIAACMGPSPAPNPLSNRIPVKGWENVQPSYVNPAPDASPTRESPNASIDIPRRSLSTNGFFVQPKPDKGLGFKL